MKIIIVGDNLIAYAITKSLIQESHDITLIGSNTIRIKHIEETLDIQTVLGSYTQVETYKVAECDNADIIITTTDVPEVDLLVSIIGLNTFKVPLMITVTEGSIYNHRHTIMPKNREETQRQIWISPAELMSNNIVELINHPDYQEIININDTFCIARLQLSDDDKAQSKTWVQRLRNKTLPGTLIGIIRGQQQIDPNKQPQANDHILLTCAKEDLNRIAGSLRTQRKIQSIIVAGISPLTHTLIPKITSPTQIKVIEKNIQQAAYFAEKHNHVTVLEGDINDAELLVSEKIDQTDAFFALSNDDEDNLVAALQAKRHQVTMVNSLVHRPEIAPIIEENGIFSIEPQKTLVDEVFTVIHSNTIIKKYSLHQNIGEIICCRIPKHLHKKSITELKCLTSSKVLHWARKKKKLNQNRTTIMHHQDHITFYMSDHTSVKQLLKQLKEPRQSLLDFLGLSGT